MKVFKHEISNPQSLINNYVKVLKQDADGFLWIQTSGGFSAFNTSKGGFESDYTEILKERNIKEKYLYNIICSKSKTVQILENNAV